MTDEKPENSPTTEELRREAIIEFFSLLEKDEKLGGKALAWILDAEMMRTNNVSGIVRDWRASLRTDPDEVMPQASMEKNKVPEDIGLLFAQTDAERKFVDAEGWPKPDVEAAAGEILNYKKSHGRGRRNPTTEEALVSCRMDQTKLAKFRRGKSEKEKTSILLAQIPYSRREEIRGFLTTFRTNSNVLSWLDDYENKRSGGGQIDPVVNDDIRDADPGFAYVKNDQALTPHEDTAIILRIIINHNRGGAQIQLGKLAAFEKRSTADSGLRF